MLNADAAVEQVRVMLDWRGRETERLDRIRGYLRGQQKLTWLVSSVPYEVRRMAEIARVNVVQLVVDSVAQSMYVDGYQTPDARENVPQWDLWQSNRMDEHQIGIHRAALSYGASYATVLPGDPVPVIRGVSPRRMTAVYGPDDWWPMWALEKRRTTSGALWRLFDDTHVYWVGEEPKPNEVGTSLTFLQADEHGAGVVPVVRYRNVVDLDDEVLSEVEPLIPIQDQINLTTFGLLVAQHFGAFRQRYILGWLAESEEQKMKAAASELWTFEDHPDDIKVGEFEQTDLAGYIDSREASLRHLATVSQTPVHELTAQLVNLSAEALVAARESHHRKIVERQTVMGESHEQTLELAGRYEGLDADPSAWVRWKDTEARSLAQTADALGKLAEMLGVPTQALWERIPGVSQQELDQWRSMAAQGDALANLTDMLDRQVR